MLLHYIYFLLDKSSQLFGVSVSIVLKNVENNQLVSWKEEVHISELSFFIEFHFVHVEVVISIAFKDDILRGNVYVYITTTKNRF